MKIVEGVRTLNLVLRYFNITLEQLLRRYHKGGYRSIAEFRTELLNVYHCEFVRLREVPGLRINAWEIKANSRTYFYNYDLTARTLKYVGVR
jgi:hypothetical protein